MVGSKLLVRKIFLYQALQPLVYNLGIILGAIFLSVFVLISGLMVLVYSQMSRDATLSHITNTNPGELGIEFWVRLVGFGVGPLIGLLTTLFPSITDFVFSWLQPGMQSLK